MAARGVALARPAWWNREGVLERLQGGQSIADQIREAMRELIGRGVLHRPEPGSYRNDIIRWRRMIPGYDAEYQAAMEVYSAGRPRTGRPPGSGAHFDQEAFLEEMRQNGGKFGEACLAVGVSAGHVFGMLNEKSSRFDPEFYEAFHEAEGARHLEIYEAMHEEGLTKRSKDEPARSGLVLTRLAEARLPHLLNPKRQVEVAAHHRHTLELAPAAMRQIAQMGKLFLPPAPEEGRVIDVTPVRELAEVEP